MKPQSVARAENFAVRRITDKAGDYGRGDVASEMTFKMSSKENGRVKTFGRKKK